MAFDATQYNWATPYSQWAPEQQRQANAFLQPQLQSGNYTGILDVAKQYGISPQNLGNAAFASVQGTPDYTNAGLNSDWASYLGQYYKDNGFGQRQGYDPTKAANWGGYGYSDQQQAGMKALFPQFDPLGTTPFHQFLQDQGINSRYGTALVKNYDPSNPQGAFTAADEFMQQQAAKELDNPNKLNRLQTVPRMQQRWGGYGGILGNSPVGMLGQSAGSYPMTQYAPQFNWQQLGGLLGNAAFGPG